jgi:AraC-like DNA-binding protein
MSNEYGLKNSGFGENIKPIEKKAGFKIIRLSDKEIIKTQCDTNSLIFVLSGKLIMNSSEALDVLLSEDQFCFMPVSGEFTLHALGECQIILFYFSTLINDCELIFFRDLWEKHDEEKKMNFQVLDVCPPVRDMVQTVVKNSTGWLMESDYPSLKTEELIYLLRISYTKDELKGLFHSIASNVFVFRQLILRNFLQAKNVSDLADLSGYKRKSFDYLFREEFGVSPYQWMLDQKAKHVYYAFSESDDLIQVIMKKYGFTMAPHFTRFCKERFSVAPWELRRRLRMVKETSLSYYI